MADTPRRTRTEPDAPETAVEPVDAADGSGTVVRRAPFSDNPHVGARGQRTQQRIVDAALEVFGEQGYHQTSIDRITTVAGCSRVSFYQYFSGKEDLFRHLTGQVARQIRASTEALDTITADQEGWATVRAWVGRHAEIYERYQPVFQAFQAAAESDEAVAGGSLRTAERNVERIRSRLATPTLPPRRLDPVLALLLVCLTRTHQSAAVLRSAAPGAYPIDRISDALADVIHRTLFGLIPEVNVHRPTGRRRAPVIEFGAVMQEVLQADEAVPQLSPAGQRTREALVQAGRDVFIRRGYHLARVDDIVEAAGVSHGAFYRYFANKDALAHVVAVRAMRGVSTAFVEIPTSAATDGSERNGALRAWLRRYGAARSAETAAIRIWVDASRQDPALEQDSAATLDWGRRQMAEFLAPRGFGDHDTDAVILIALLSAFGEHDRPSTRADSTAAIDAAAYVIERGLLGLPG